MNRYLGVAVLLAALLPGCAISPRGSGDLGVVVERARGSVQVVETTTRTRLARVEGLGDLSHASVVYARDQRYAYVFGRDGGLTKVDLLRGAIEKRIVQAGNAIGGAISQDGKVVAVSNYEPGGVRLFDAGTLEPLSPKFRPWAPMASAPRSWGWWMHRGIASCLRSTTPAKSGWLTRATRASPRCRNSSTPVANRTMAR